MHNHHHHAKRVLFLLKEHSYGNYTIAKSGLLNSVKHLVKALMFFRLVREAEIKICVDANSIDRELHLFKPNICFIEAIWVTGKKLLELRKLHPKVTFIVRVHSNIPFLAMEGNAIERLREYKRIPGVYVSFNNQFTSEYLMGVLPNAYLPNVYFHGEKCGRFELQKNFIHIGCFGSLRPLKNQLIQAVAAINYGNNNDTLVKFHINSSRIEQQGEGVLKNMRALFRGTLHELVEHKWMSPEDFHKIVRNMDIGLQVSFTESFNIVTANFVTEEIPIIVSEDIDWMPSSMRVKATDAVAIESKIREVLRNKKRFVRRQTKALNEYNDTAIQVWEGFLR